MSRNGQPGGNLARLWRRHGAAASWAVPLLLYAILAAVLLPMHWERINPDAVAYIRRALLLTRGDWANSVSGYWSPLISWCIAPLMLAGMDGLHAAHLVLALWGGAYVICFHRLLRVLNVTDDRWVLAATTIVALAAIPAMLRPVAPDVIMAACLLAFLACGGHQRLLHSTPLQVLTGVLGGITYLAKAYAFPVVVLLLPLTIAMHVYSAGLRSRANWLAAARAMLVSGAALAVVAGTWIGVLSHRYGRLTISTSGPINHAYIGPNPNPKSPLPYGVEPDPYIALIENPDRVPVATWSPLASRENFAHQMRVVWINLKTLLGLVGGFAAMYLAVPVLAATPLGLLALRADRRGQAVLAWLLCASAIYGLGLTAVCWIHRDPRYFVPVALPLTVAVAVLLLAAWRNSARAPAAVRLLVAVLAVAFAGPAMAGVLKAFGSSQPTIYRDVAQAMRTAGHSGPVVTTHRQKGLYAAYFLDEKVVKFPPVRHPEEAEEILRQHGIQALLMWRDRQGRLTYGQGAVVADDEPEGNSDGDNEAQGALEAANRQPARPQVAERMTQRPGWTRILTLDAGRHGQVEVYAPPWRSEGIGR